MPVLLDWGLQGIPDVRVVNMQFVFRIEFVSKVNRALSLELHVHQYFDQ
jgi:hypothetical protein